MARLLPLLALVILASPGLTAQNLSGWSDGDTPPVVRMTAPRPVTPPTSTAAAFSQSSASVAGVDGQYLVAWLDGRTESNGPAIFAGRVAADGAVLDPHGILLGPAYVLTPPGGFVTSAPQAFALPEMYLVIWSRAHDTLRVRVGRDGNLIDREPTTLTSRSLLATASDGKDVLIATFSLQGVGGMILGPDGEIKTGEIALRSSNTYRAVAAAGDVFMLVGDTTLHPSFCGASVCQRTAVERISKGGESLSYTILPFRFNLLALASDGANRFLLIYEHQDGTGLMARVLNASGELGEEIVLDPHTTASDAEVLWNGSEFVVVWTHFDAQWKGEVRLVRVSSRGDPPSPPVTIGSASGASQYSPALASTEGTILLASTHTGPAEPELRGKFLTSSGSPVSEEFELTSSPLVQERPNLASNGLTQLITWVDYLPTEQKLALRAMRLAADGRPIDPTPMEIEQQANWYRMIESAVASDGQSFLIVWDRNDGRYQSGHLFARRLNPDGSWETPAIDTGLSTCGFSQHGLIWNGSKYFLIRTKCTEQGYQVVGTFLDSTGQTIAPEIPISDATQYYKDPPVVEFNGTMFLAVWSYVDFKAGSCTSCLLPPPPLTIRAARITAEGIVLDHQGVRLTSHGMKGFPAVAWGGGVFLITWQGYSEPRATRFSPDGMMLDGSPDTDGMPLFLPRFYSLPVGVAWDGRSFVVFWRGKGSNTRTHLNGMYFDADELLVRQRPSSFLISEEFSAYPPGSTRSMVDAAMVNGHLLFAYSRVSPEPEWGGVRRIFTRTLLAPPPRTRTSPRR